MFLLFKCLRSQEFPIRYIIFNWVHHHLLRWNVPEQIISKLYSVCDSTANALFHPRFRHHQARHRKYTNLVHYPIIGTNWSWYLHLEAMGDPQS